MKSRNPWTSSHEEQLKKLLHEKPDLSGRDLVSVEPFKAFSLQTLNNHLKNLKGEFSLI